MSEYSEFKRGQRGKERMAAQVRQLQEAIAKRNARIKELEEKAKIAEKAYAVLRQIADNVDRMREEEVSYSLVDRVKECRAERDRLRRQDERVSKLTECLVSIAEHNTGGLDAATYAYSVLNPD